MEVLDHECPSCGANLPFNPKTQKWDCLYCGSSFALEQLKEIEKKAEKASDKSVPMDEYTCSNCGASILADETTSATFCVYCGSSSIIKSQFKGEFSPSKIIPFANTKEEVVQKFAKFSKGKIFSPKEFTNIENIEKIMGVYIPFWIYDLDVDATINASTTIVTTTRTPRVTKIKTDKYITVRSGTMSYEKIPADGARKFDDNIMDSVEPFDYKGLKDFNMSYLSGFFAEKYDVCKEEAKQRIYSRVKNSSEDMLAKTLKGYSTITIDNSKIKIDYKTIEYVLLPVWMVNVKYKDKLHFFAMNGQTGKMVGNIPIDTKKSRLFSLGVFFGTAILLSIIIFLIGLIM